MKSASKLSPLALALAASLGACSTPTDETDESTGASTTDEAPPAEYEARPDYGGTPFLEGGSIKEWVVRGDTAFSNETAKLWISRDGAFTVLFPTAKPWNGAFQADTSAASVTLEIINDGGSKSAETAPIKGAWSYAVTASGIITLSRTGSTAIVITAK